MRVAKPPDTSQIFDQTPPERVFEVIRSVGANPRPDYPHWDKVRFLKPPVDITPEQWWFAIKLNRGLMPLPLEDAAGTPFKYGTPSSVLRLLHFVDQHCSGEIAMAEVVTSNEQARHHYLVNSLMEEAIRSSQLEGATTSRQVAKELLRTGRAPSDRSERMILNNYRALEFMRESGRQKLTPDLVITLQRILTEDTLDDPTAAGRLQTPDEDRVAVWDRTENRLLHVPPPADQLPMRLQAMCDFANQADDERGRFIHPVVRAILLHFWLAYDHPFLDGNGRTARALFYWYMRRRGYWLIEYLSVSKIIHEGPSKYAKAFLFTETDDGDTTYFLLYHLNRIRRAVETLHDYLGRKVKEVQDMQELIQNEDGLNHRQLALLTDAIRHPANVYTYRSHAASHRVTQETARTDLFSLRERGLLERRKMGRKHAYIPVPDLPTALKM
jgi:Fic family protein